jgi:hypothetical protein
MPKLVELLANEISAALLAFPQWRHGILRQEPNVLLNGWVLLQVLDCTWVPVFVLAMCLW